MLREKQTWQQIHFHVRRYVTALLFIHMLKSNTRLTEMTDKEDENTHLNAIVFYYFESKLLFRYHTN